MFMEKITELKLDKNSSKPIFELRHDCGIDITCLFDTGADTPVWCSGLDYFKFLYPDSTKARGNFLLGGFGRGATSVEMYVIPEFKIGDITYRQFYVAIDTDRRFAWDLVLSYTLFTKMDYSNLNRNRDTPVIKIIHDREIYATCITVYQKDTNYVERIFSFLSEHPEK